MPEVAGAGRRVQAGALLTGATANRGSSFCSWTLVAVSFHSVLLTVCRSARDALLHLQGCSWLLDSASPLLAASGATAAAVALGTQASTLLLHQILSSC